MVLCMPAHLMQHSMPLKPGLGTLLWSYTTDNAIESTPAVADGVVYVGSTDHTLYALNADTGDRVWSFETSAGIQSSPAVAGGIVYVGSWDHTLVCFRCHHRCQDMGLFDRGQN